MTTDYISGGMTGFPEFNFPIFDSAARARKAAGHKVFSPADHDRACARKAGIDDITTVPGYAEGDVDVYSSHISELATTDLLGWDFKTIIDKCDGIIMLPGWEQSTGARYERIVAEATGKLVLLAVEPEGYPADEPDPWVFIEDAEQKRLTTFLRGFAAWDYVAPTIATLLSAAAPRELLAELNTRLGHIAQFREPLAKIEANLA